MTKKREPTRRPTKTTATKRKGEADADQPEGKSRRGTAAGLRSGAGSATEAKQRTAKTGKLSQKELTKRGGPGRAGNQPAQKAHGAKRSNTPTRGRGSKAQAGA